MSAAAGMATATDPMDAASVETWAAGWPPSSRASVCAPPVKSTDTLGTLTTVRSGHRTWRGLCSARRTT